MANNYNHQKIEAKWRNKWEKEGLYSPNLGISKDNFYNLWMFPYPSAEGLHAGHAFASTGSDIYGRFMRMQGKQVFQPIGYDSFGIHSENFAISIGEQPRNMIQRTTKNYAKQLKSLGHAYDWNKTVTTSDVDYYRWTQWIFTQMFKAGLAYRKKEAVNWCPSCKTVLADEQVIDGKCERCGSVVEKRELEQWFFRITDYADKLLKGLTLIDWPEKIKIAQRNWIGRSEGALIEFKTQNSKLKINVFTTRPDTLYGATFIAISPELAQTWLDVGWKASKNITKYIKESQKSPASPSEAGRVKLKAQSFENKTGVFSGVYAVNPATKQEIPVWVADYVLMEYGSGAIMGVPAHDERDMEFAKKFKINIAGIPPDESLWELIEKKGWGKKHINYHLRDWLISRQRYWGPPIPIVFCQKCADEGKSWFSEAAKHSLGNSKSKIQSPKKIGNWKLEIGNSLIHEDQRDWDHAGWWPEENLPVELPYLKNYQPKGTGRGPLASSREFYEVACPECGAKARRETDVSDTFLDSSWYFLAYPMQGTKEWNKGPSTSPSATSSGSSDSGQDVIGNKIVESWLPVDLYFGGAEHAVLHLMYARFVWKVLYDLGYLPATMPSKALGWEEPFPRFFAHGLMVKDGAKMSKSKGNVVNPDEYVEKFGADTLRLYLMFMGPMDGYPDFRDTGIEGMRRFVEKVWGLYVAYKDVILVEEKDSQEILIKMHQTIKKVTEDIEKFHYNTAISAIMEYVNVLRTLIKNSKLKIQNDNSKTKIYKNKSPITNHQLQIRCAEWDEALEVLVKLLAPFAPYMTEEIWVDVLGEKFSIHTSTWPKFVPELVIEETVTIAVQVDGKLRATLKLKAQSEAKLKTSSAKLKDEVVKAAKADPRIQKWLLGKKVKKTIFVPSKLVNFVTK